MSTPPAKSEGGPPENKTEWQKSEAKFTAKQHSEYVDPCQGVADRSLKCLRRNGGDRSMCMDYFEAYRDCKKNWMEEMREAKAKAKAARSWF